MERSVIFHSTAALLPEVRDAAPDVSQKTVMVASLARGGGSVVGAVLDAIGVYMGPPEEIASGGTFENFSMRSPDVEVRQQEIERCNAAHDLWGFKTGGGDVTLAWLDELRNPYLIVVLRGIVAHTQRAILSEPIYDGLPFEFVARELWQRQRILFRAFARLRIPRMLVSYERAVTHPETLIYGLAEFLGLEPGNQRWLEAFRRINRQGGYVQICSLPERSTNE